MDPRKRGSLSGTIHETKSLSYIFNFTTHEDVRMTQNINRSIREINSCKIEQVEHRRDQDPKTNTFQLRLAKALIFNTCHITHCWSICSRRCEFRQISTGCRFPRVLNRHPAVREGGSAKPCNFGSSGFITARSVPTSYVLCSLWERFLPGV